MDDCGCGDRVDGGDMIDWRLWYQSVGGEAERRMIRHVGRHDLSKR